MLEPAASTQDIESRNYSAAGAVTSRYSDNATTPSVSTLLKRLGRRLPLLRLCSMLEQRRHCWLYHSPVTRFIPIASKSIRPIPKSRGCTAEPQNPAENFTAAAARVGTSSVRNNEDTWMRTVNGEISSSRAISLLVLPCAIKRSTSC